MFEIIEYMKIANLSRIDSLDSLDYYEKMASNKWQIQTAKNKLSEVIDKSVVQGPQIITKHGKETAVIISYDEYKKFAPPMKGLKELLLNSELDGIDFDLIRRDSSPTGRATPFSFDDE